MALNPGETIALTNYGNFLTYAGRPEEAIPLYQKAIRPNPFAPSVSYVWFGVALRGTGRFEEAVSAYKKATQCTPNFLWSHIQLTATYSMMGREEEARAEAAEVLRINPKFSMDFYAKTSILKDQSQKEKVANALRKAGLK